MKIFYKYIFCLLVYVISFASTNPFAPFDKGTFSSIYGEVSLSDSVGLTFGDRSDRFRDEIIKLNRSWFSTFTNLISKEASIPPMSIYEWEHASFGEVLEEVVPSILSMNNITKDFLKEYKYYKDAISEAMMRIANRGTDNGGHVAVARVILKNGQVIPLSRFFLSGEKKQETEIKSLINSSQKESADLKRFSLDYFFTISESEFSCKRGAQGVPHSERAIGLYLQTQLKNDLLKMRISMNLSDISVIQIKNALPMCHNCELFWGNCSHIDTKNDGFEAQGGGFLYNVWRDFDRTAILLCSNYIEKKTPSSDEGSFFDEECSLSKLEVKSIFKENKLFPAYLQYGSEQKESFLKCPFKCCHKTRLRESSESTGGVFKKLRSSKNI